MKKLFFILVLITLLACNRNSKIVVDDINLSCDTSFFRGIMPDMYYDELVAVVGEPSEFVDLESGDEKDHNPIYYYKEGKIMCFWSGSKKDEMGTIVYTPYDNTHIRIDDFIKRPLKEYDITSETEKVSIYKGDTLFFIVHLDNLEVRKVSFLKLKK